MWLFKPFLKIQTLLKLWLSVLQQGPVTRCDVAHLRWYVLKSLHCIDIKIACDLLRCIFYHVSYFSPDFRISQLFIVRFSNGLQHRDGNSKGFPVIYYELKLFVKYLL